MNKGIKKQNDFGADFQCYSFKNETWRITAGNIEVEQNEDPVSDNTIQHNVSVEELQFEISKNNQGKFEFEVLNKNSDVLNFLINTSRIHWGKELLGKNEFEKKAYLKANRFNFKGEGLSPDEIQDHTDHIVNKIYTIGYLLHGYKDESKAWAVYAMDNDLNDNGKGYGGCGKSVLFEKLISVFKNTHFINGMHKHLFQANHRYGSLTKNIDYVFFDDARKEFDVRNLFECISSDWHINPMNKEPFTIPFKESPKIAILSNYLPSSQDSSVERRLLHSVFSDYYHYSDEYSSHSEDNAVWSDFGAVFFLQDWNENQFNDFINFMMQCLSFYLGQTEKINVPTPSLTKVKIDSEELGKLRVKAGKWDALDKEIGAFYFREDGSEIYEDDDDYCDNGLEGIGEAAASAFNWL